MLQPDKLQLVHKTLGMRHLLKESSRRKRVRKEMLRTGLQSRLIEATEVSAMSDVKRYSVLASET